MAMEKRGETQRMTPHPNDGTPPQDRADGTQKRMILRLSLIFLSFQSTPTRRSRMPRVRLRKHQELDHVRVEEAWSFRQASNSNTTSDNKTTTDKVGEACYVAATVQNRRYYGVLVEQDALQAPSVLHWQDEATGLELNRRMRALQQARAVEEGTNYSTLLKSEEETKLKPEEIQMKTEETQTNSDDKMVTDESSPADTTDDAPEDTPMQDTAADEGAMSRKRPRPDDLPTDRRAVQKFVYHADADYRTLLATYVNVAAAAMDTVVDATDIQTACDHGGGFVGTYYYQFEVSVGKS